MAGDDRTVTLFDPFGIMSGLKEWSVVSRAMREIRDIDEDFRVTNPGERPPVPHPRGMGLSVFPDASALTAPFTR